MLRLTNLLAAAALVLATQAAIAGDVVKGSKDHPLLTRYPDSHITDYEKNFNSVKFKVSKTEENAVEGQATIIKYFYKSADDQPSPLQIIRNYQNAIKAIKGEVVFERTPADMDPGETTLKVLTGGKEIWIKVEPDIWSAPTQSYRLSVVEVEAMAVHHRGGHGMVDPLVAGCPHVKLGGEGAFVGFAFRACVHQAALRDQQGVVFVLRSAEIDFRRAARLDELLEVHCTVSERKCVSLCFRQEIRDAAGVLVCGLIRVACVDASTFRPQAIPDGLLPLICISE